MESKRKFNIEKAYQKKHMYVNWGNGIGAFCPIQCEINYSKKVKYCWSACVLPRDP